MGLFPVEFDDTSHSHIQFVIIPQGLKLFLGIIISDLVVGVVENDDEKWNGLGSLRVQREHLLHLHL